MRLGEKNFISLTYAVIPAKTGGQHLTTCCLVRMAPVWWGIPFSESRPEQGEGFREEVL